MRLRATILATFLFLILAPYAGRAQLADCPDCLLGLYADPQMTQTQALPGGVSIDLYLGIRYGATALAELSGVEFSIAGMESLDAVVEPYDDPPAVLGDPHAPAQIDTLYGSGGMNIAWGRCLGGDRLLARITLQPRHGWQQATVLRVKRRFFAGGSPAIPHPLLARCDDPYFTLAPLRGGTFLLGPAGQPQCTVSAPQTDFGVVGEGVYRRRAFTVTNAGAGVLDGVASEGLADFRIEEGDPSYLLAGGQSKSFRLGFLPTRPGPQTCTVTLGPGCGTLVFTGRAPDVTAIADLYAGADTLAGRKVAVEAQVFIPATLQANDFSYTGWVQDDSERGIEVVRRLSGSSFPGLTSRTNRVRASGTLVRAGAAVRIDTLRAVTVLGADNPLLVPRYLSAAEASTGDWEGAYVAVIGRVLSAVFDYRGTRYVLYDASGTVQVLSVVGPLVPVGQDMSAAGARAKAVHQGVYVGNPDDLRYGEVCGLRSVTVGSAVAAVGARVEVAVQVGTIRSAADTLDLRIAYDPRVVQFVGASRTGLAAGWPVCEASAVAPDTLRIRAANTTAIAANSSGEIFRLAFDVVGCAPRKSRLVITAVGHDLEGSLLCNGEVACADCASDGDVNADGTLTPGDAQCAFEIFLAGETVPAECDVAGNCEVAAADADCNLVVTPGDALGIFRRWLANQTRPVPCARKLRAPAGSGAGGGLARPDGARYRLDWARAARLGPDSFAVPLEMLATTEPAAFGVEVQFDPQRVEFVRLRRESAGTSWQALDARQLAPGRIRIGGFDAREVAPGDDGAWRLLAALEFRGDASALARVEWLEQIPPAAAPAALPDHLFLGLPRPNPAEGGEVALDLAIPAGRAPHVVARVLDVRGRQVKTLREGGLGPGFHVLRWDRTDARSQSVAAGIYVIEVRLGDAVERRKLVVLR